MSKVPDAAAIVGQLADVHRREAFAALVLGARTLDEVVGRTGRSAADMAKALGRLVEAGMVVQGASGGLHLLGESLAVAARDALAKPVDTSPDAGTERAKVMRAFVDGDRLLRIPSQHSKRLVILDWLAQDFEPGRRYSESMVNLLLGRHHHDTAALRRYLVDEEFLDRADGQYWRAGGTVTVGEHGAGS